MSTTIKGLDKKTKFIPKFEFVIKNSDLKKMLQPLKKLGIECAELEFKHNKMTFTEMDVLHVIQVKGTIFSELFEQFHVSIEGRINYNIEEFN